MATGTWMPWPFEQFFDNNGDPLNGGQLFTYLAGTTTPVATYSDVGLTTPNANPIIMNSAGYPSSGAIFLSPGVSYKFVLQDSGGSTLATRDNVGSVPGTSNPTNELSAVNLRLSLTSGTPVTTADVTAATTIYIEPYKGNRIALYDGATWNLRTLTATSFAVPATTSTMYDVFVYDNATVPTYETLAWTNDTTRATSLVTQDGVLVKSGAVTRRYLGSFRTTTVSGQTEDSAVKRYLWNYYNRVTRQLLKQESTASWNYTTAVLRQANAAAANQVDIIVGVAEVTLQLRLTVYAQNSGTTFAYVAIGQDSTTTAMTGLTGGFLDMSVAANPATGIAAINIMPAVGRHFYAWLEESIASGTTTFFGTTTATGMPVVSGLQGTIDG